MPDTPARPGFVPGLYVTGTDTGVGKTVASATLMHALRRHGLRVLGMKPVASGCERRAEGTWANEDALALQRAASAPVDYELVNPYALPVPTAPELAAREAGVDLRLEPMLAAHAVLAGRADVVVVEGVGGWLAPLTETLDQAEVARAMDLPVVMVVGIRLGCINHARLTARAIAADGFALRGWIGSHVEPGMLHADDNERILRRVLPVPCIGVLPYAPDADPADRARHLDGLAALQA
ncbi:dethiobiotin synthase [Coralloluteibacterium stylophorae]|uniref:ATP-dependent dethiobiotin synthetase BioD n=1 Tax=Coralloluteibacterium stylophorae TaxID=1776034 RepID=A0A8J7VSP8_9GAMM|nr:dethiobiotin synthase [Coralloluteibacterium stylophorae]MBS7458452.1 dethiobiotin synthase [Coralloluteibacterium stylophorae]